MNVGSAETALARIEAALIRIEKAQAEPVPDGGLRERHDRLRASAAEAMHRLDALLAAQPQPKE
jgi:hypothetical protein